eukprot:TRINITY_DN9878_c0_g3_i1.p1 TRINITY_DN9878_c0_g3~~TRINITY_DN9878_c0_g3_i1.p1  ORF type:complete len:682 (+),score=161.08 TRINITY_DN9878_c0_g3_i1:78-2048(+)
MPLAILDAECVQDQAELVIRGVCFLQRRVEAAGRSFHETHEKPLLQAKKRGRGNRSGGKGNESDEEAGDTTADAKWKTKKREKGTKAGGALKMSSLLEGENLYKLLEVSESASIDQIKKQYRKLVLVHHPDKKEPSGDGGGGGGGYPPSKGENGGLNEGDVHFVKIQEAYEIMSDQTKRRQYDSTLEFDESVPDHISSKLGFFGTFAPVFGRNGRFSTRTPLPDIGDENTEYAKVHKFYDWWYEFESWRDFSMHDEYTLEDAEFREERRWMERQNQKLRKKYEVDERKRILRLVETAERLDPRLRAEREEKEAKKREEKERRARLKQEEEDGKRRVEEERKQKEEQEKADREEKERAERELRKQGKQVLKGLRQRFRKCIQGRCGDFSKGSQAELLQEFAISVDAEPLEALCVRLEALKSAADVEKALQNEVNAWRKSKNAEEEEQAKQREEARRREEERASEAKKAAAASAAGPPWSPEELGMLAKGLQKFPGGTGGRWTQITQLLQANGVERSEREVVEKTKELSEGKSLRSMGAQLSAEWQAPGAKASTSAPAAKAKAGTTSASANGSAAPKASGKNSAVASVAASPSASGGSGEEWSAEQQRALEAALQTHPSSLDKNERWRLIAEAVPGKTKAQCVERFKYLRDQIVKQKN